MSNGREIACTAEATARLKGIARAHGSLVSEYAEDGKRLVEAARAYAAAAEQFNERFRRRVTFG